MKTSRVTREGFASAAIQWILALLGLDSWRMIPVHANPDVSWKRTEQGPAWPMQTHEYSGTSWRRPVSEPVGTPQKDDHSGICVVIKPPLS